MRRFFAIVRATTLEVLSESLAHLLLLSSLSLTIITPAMHYHQFGEPSRMARDAGLSALLVGGLSIVIFCTIKTFRREITSGTLHLALAHSISRAQFFIAKLFGVALATLTFSATIFSAMIIVVNGSEIGARVAFASGKATPVWGVSFAFAIAIIVLPLIIGAILNRFANLRFTLTSTISALIVAIIGLFYRFDISLILRFLPVAIILFFPMAIFLTISGTCAVIWRENIALAVCGFSFLLTLPLLGNYYLSEALADASTLPLIHLLRAALASVPTIFAFALIGIRVLNRQDLPLDCS